MKPDCTSTNRYLKGQALSFDLLMAVVIFSFALAILVTQISYQSREIDEVRKQNEMIEASYEVSEIFFREGYPKDWNESNVEILGLEKNNRISWDKLQKLESLGYQKSLALIGLDYDYNITIDGENLHWSFGRSPENSTTLVKTDRLGILNSSLVSVRIMIFNYE